MIAYLDCVGGLAGDMLIAALLDAGASAQTVQALPSRLGLEHVQLRIDSVQRHGIGALRFIVEGDFDQQRSWRSIRAQLADAQLDEQIRARALAIFERLAQAEAAIHGVSPDEVHFHELGAADALIDIVGAVTLIDELDITRLVCSPLPIGRGLVQAAHGILPLPAPATAALLVDAPVYGVEIEAELVTPTGAAVASALADGWGAMPAMTLDQVGYGAGAREFAQRPNIVRVLMGREPERQLDGDHAITLLETNLDDLSPELVPDAVERCFIAGALDVWTAPVSMKKGRPGIVFSALARPEHEADVARAMLEQTTALGVRVTPMRRYELDREQRIVELDGGQVRIKVGLIDGRVVNVAPEHDDCAELARATGATVKSVWAAALAAASRWI